MFNAVLRAQGGNQAIEVCKACGVVQCQMANLMTCRPERIGKAFDGGKKGANLLDVMTDIGCLLVQLGDDIEHALILLLIPRMMGIELVTENKPKAVIGFHGHGCFLIRNELRSANRRRRLNLRAVTFGRWPSVGQTHRPGHKF